MPQRRGGSAVEPVPAGDQPLQRHLAVGGPAVGSPARGRCRTGVGDAHCYLRRRFPYCGVRAGADGQGQPDVEVRVQDAQPVTITTPPGTGTTVGISTGTPAWTRQRSERAGNVRDSRPSCGRQSGKAGPPRGGSRSASRLRRSNSGASWSTSTPWRRDRHLARGGEQRGRRGQIGDGLGWLLNGRCDADPDAERWCRNAGIDGRRTDSVPGLVKVTSVRAGHDKT
jgi:hypothetical protein